MKQKMLTPDVSKDKKREPRISQVSGHLPCLCVESDKIDLQVLAKVAGWQEGATWPGLRGVRAY